MSVLDSMLLSTLETIRLLGSTCSVETVSSVYSTSGTVIETITTTDDVLCSDLAQDARRYASSDTTLRATGTFYFPASGLEVVPVVGSRIIYKARTFHVLASFPHTIQGDVVAYRVDVGEVGT